MEEGEGDVGLQVIKMDWVDVNERLPESDKQVLALGCDYSNQAQLCLAKFTPSRGWITNSCVNDVCYWIYFDISLPECKPYETLDMPLEGSLSELEEKK